MAEEAKNLGGRPRKDIDYEQLKELCHIHCTGEECAAIIGVDYDTLNSELQALGEGGFSDYFKKHSSGGKASLRRKQFASAEEGSVPLMIWLGKQYLGQADKAHTEHTGKDGEDLIPKIDNTELARHIAFALSKGVKESN